MKELIKNKTALSILAIILVTCLIFFKIFLKGLYPIPGDLLVSFYFPWYSGGWEGYNPWTTHKELLSADSIRQIFPWKAFAMEQLKAGVIPLWNPFTFSGQPLIANFQSSVFYPLNIFYFVTNSANAWILLIITQPLLGGIFMYMLLRSYKISNISSLFGATAFMFSSYLITWMENGNIAHSYIWLPLAFLAINKFFEKTKFRYLLVLIASLSLSILGGHPQTAIYIYIAVSIYWIYKALVYKKNTALKFALLAFSIGSSLLLTSIQLIPTYDFYESSPISLPFSREVFDKSILPFQNLLTFFAPDFFGHPATGNFWSQSYGDFTPYIGVIPLAFSIWGILVLWKSKFIKFASTVSALFILAALNGPITWMIKTFRVPILDSTTSARFISISIFLLVIIAAFALEDFIKNFKNKKYITKFMKFLTIFSLIYAILWLFTLFGDEFFKSDKLSAVNLKVTQRNLILPTALFLSLPFGLIGVYVLEKFLKINKEYLKNLYIAGIFVGLLFGGLYFSNKFLPFAPKEFIFPQHNIFTWLDENAGLYRFYGGGTAHVDFNYPAVYGVYGAEGYDTLRYERYAQLLASGFDGKVPQVYLRSDAVFDNTENGYRKRLFELLGVKYLLDKEDDPKSNEDWHYERFSGDNVKGIWQNGKFQVYEREPTLPRIFLTTSYIVAKDDNEIIEKIYDSSFDLKTLILEKQPSIEIEYKGVDITIPQVQKYSPNEILITTNTDANSLLFISDAFDKDWKVYVNGSQAELLRAHYTLRAVEVPSGNQKVRLVYDPKSFKVGLYLTIASLTFLFLLSLYLKKQKKL